MTALQDKKVSQLSNATLPLSGAELVHVVQLGASKKVTAAQLSGSGVAGPTGPAGAVGPTGAVGVVGPTGAQGVSGPTGATGDIGPTGSAGVTGDIGPTGDQGVVGPTGTQGVSGLTAYVSVPLLANSSGTPGQYAADADFFYVCIATDTWLKCSIITWI